jgi:hypothetical protein
VPLSAGSPVLNSSATCKGGPRCHSYTPILVCTEHPCRGRIWRYGMAARLLHSATSAGDSASTNACTAWVAKSFS